MRTWMAALVVSTWCVILDAQAVRAAPPVPQEVQRGAQYRGPRSLQLSEYGLAFLVPAGWIGNRRPDEDCFLLFSPRHPSARVDLCAAHVTLAEIQAAMAEPMNLDANTSITPVSALTVTPTVITGEYTAVSFGQPMQARVATVVGKHGASVLITALGNGEALQAAMAAAEVVFNSVRFSKLRSAAPAAGAGPSVTQSSVPAPAPEESAPVEPRPAASAPSAPGPQVPSLSGLYLKHAGSTRGGTSYTASYNFCSNGRFRYHNDMINRSNTGTVAGANADTGRWQQQGTTLKLTWDDGDVGSLEVSSRGGVTYLGNKGYLPQQSDCSY